jgi:hypothetical protein
MNKFYLTLVVLLLAISNLSSQNYNKDFSYKLNSGWVLILNLAILPALATLKELQGLVL